MKEEIPKCKPKHIPIDLEIVPKINLCIDKPKIHFHNNAICKSKCKDHQHHRKHHKHRKHRKHHKHHKHRKHRKHKCQCKKINECKCKTVSDYSDSSYSSDSSDSLLVF